MPSTPVFPCSICSAAVVFITCLPAISWSFTIQPVPLRTAAAGSFSRPVFSRTLPFSHATLPHRSVRAPNRFTLSANIAPPRKLEFLERTKLQESIKVLAPLFNDVRAQEFFRFYAVDLLSSCTFFPTADAPCDMDRCEIEGTEETPESLRERDEREHDFRLDGWVRWDMPGDFTEYYDLVQEPERYTEYDGKRVWDFIHQKICFQYEIEQEGFEWKQDFNRAISGFHTSVSAHIVETMGLSEADAVAEYKRRIRDIPDALENLVYAYYLQLCAIKNAKERLITCDYMGKKEQVQPLMREILNNPFLSEQCVADAETAMRHHATQPNAKVWKARLRTRDLLGIMNCVQCNVCRLHGKVAALGVAVALQLILGREGEGGDVELLHRIEIAALMTTAGKFASAIKFCTEMEHKYQESAQA